MLLMSLVCTPGRVDIAKLVLVADAIALELLLEFVLVELSILISLSTGVPSLAKLR